MFFFPHTRRLLSSLSSAALRTLTPLSSFSPSSVRLVNTHTHESTRRWKTTHTQGESTHHTHHHEDLFAHQKTLPSLPLPTLHDSCQRFLKSAEPLVDDMEGLKEVVSKFVAEGEGLHEELARIKQENVEGSWVSGFWETMYLEDRSPLPINTNPFFVFNKFEGETDQIVLLASLIRSVASLHQRIRSRQFAPDVVGNTHFCSYQYPRIFSSARIPGATRDTYVSTPTANHVVLNVAGHFFAFHVLTDTGDVISQALCEKVIKKCAKDILDHGMVSARNGSIPFLTALPRPDWAKGRSELESSSEQNADIFRIIDGAIAMFTFSDIDPSSSEEAAVEAHVNTSGWFDKQQFIVYRNGQLAVNMEHTAVDGHTMLRCFDDMLAQLKKGVIGNTADDASFSKLAKPFYLDWDIPDDPQFEELLDGAEQHFTELKRSISSNFVDFRVFGADWIKSVGISPDAFVQICFQLAHFRMYGKVVSTYESVNMKRYRLGRTETGRSLTSPMKRFLYAMTDILASHEEKVAALRDAGKAHVEQLASCQRGEGFDRHLWSLQKVAMMRQNRLNNYELPEFFSHESYLTMRNIILSTSNCSTHGMESFGFGPVSPQGFGLGYGIEKSRIMVYITSFADPQLGGERADLFGMHLTQSLRDCFALLEKTKSLSK